MPLITENKHKPIIIIDNIVRVEQNDIFLLDTDVYTLRINAEWSTKILGIICDLDLTLYLFDDHARFIEKIDSSHRVSSDGNCSVSADLDVGSQNNLFMESAKIDINSIDSKTDAILIYLDGGPKNFQFASNIGIQCLQVPSHKASYSISESLGSKQTKALFNFITRPKKDYHGIAMAVLYKDGWYTSTKPKWNIKILLEPFYVTNTKEIEEKCFNVIVTSIPTLMKFRPRVFNSVRDICNALSSTSLPKLKKKFLKNKIGLPISDFTQVLFKQLYETQPHRINEEGEAAYLVAMIQEMFYQIDFNGDLNVDWDEFTSKFIFYFICNIFLFLCSVMFCLFDLS